ncbi:PCNA-associated factor isoform X3 [Cavia porcellus]|uniref:PCNA-associated factor isoform X3 n=1 Tax=Cavia porcellus TaxID=10141 RepID=UPI002FE13193
MGEARNQWASRLAQVEKRGKAPLVNRGGSVSCGSLSCEPLSLGSQCSSLVSSRATMVRTKADSVPGTYRKVVASRAPRKVLGPSTSATNSRAFSSSRKEHVLCNLITVMMKKNRTFLLFFNNISCLRWYSRIKICIDRFFQLALLNRHLI